MNADLNTVLAGLRRQFLDGVDERLAQLEQDLLILGEGVDWSERFAAVYRGVHNLKGAGGTHGLALMSAVAHALENRLESLRPGALGGAEMDALLAHLDLLHDCALAARDGGDEDPLRERLEALCREEALAVLLEPSRSMAAMLADVLRGAGLQVSHSSDGVQALNLLLHQPVRLLVCARHAGSLGGAGVVAALRASDGPNQHTPAVLLTSDDEQALPGTAFDQVLRRGADLPERLQQTISRLLH